jgi:hypothetical protein
MNTFNHIFRYIFLYVYAQIQHKWILIFFTPKKTHVFNTKKKQLNFIKNKLQLTCSKILKSWFY